MRKILIVSILAIAIIVGCVGCSFGVAPANYSVSGSQAANPSSNPGSSSDPGASVNPSSGPTETVVPTDPDPSPVGPSSDPAPAPVWGTLDPVEYNSSLVVYDSSNPMDVKINLGGGVSSVKSIQYVGQTPNTWNFRYENGLLYIPQSFLSSKGVGKFNIKVNINGGADSITCKLCAATKVITETYEFMNIGTDDDYPLNGTYVLGKDLDFTGVDGARPIGFNDSDDPTPFMGVFDGAGHTISNLVLDLRTTSQAYNAGVFGMNQGTITSLCLKDCILHANGYSIGLVVGTNKGTIENVIVDGGSVNCYASSNSDTNCFIAGFAGINGANATIKNCICAIGSIKKDIWNGKLTRAFCGKTWGALVNCYATKENMFVVDLTNDDHPTWPFAGWGGTPGDQNSYISTVDTCNGLTYTAVSAAVDGNTYEILAEDGSFAGCAIKTVAEMSAGTTANLYAEYSTSAWNITGTALPSLIKLATRP